MLEAALFIIVAAGGLLALMRRSQHQDTSSDNHALPDHSSILAYGGLYSLNKPGEAPRLSAFSDLQWLPNGLTLRDNQTNQRTILYFGHIQWVSAITITAEGVATIMLHLDLDQHWRTLELHLPEAEMALFAKVLQKTISASRLNIGRPPVAPVGPIPARLVEETLQGESTLGTDISLFLLPHLLIVLDDDKVVARLNMSSIRRVLAVERISNKLDALLYRNLPEGIVRLYSLHETASFALPQYQELAEEISVLSRCPVEFILQEDKTAK